MTDLLSQMQAAVAEKPKSSPEALGKLIKTMQEKEALVAKLTQDLATATDELAKVTHTQIPEAMDALDMKEWKLKDGTILRLKETWRDGVTADTQAEAFDWMQKHGHEALIKTQLTLEFSRGELVLATLAKKVLAIFLPEVVPNEKEFIPWNTFSSWIASQVEQGIDLPKAIGARLIREGKFYKK